MARDSARGPHDDHHTPSKMADCHGPQLTVVPAIVRKIERVDAKDLDGILEIKSAFRKRGGTLGRIASDLHLFIVATNNPPFKGKPFNCATRGLNSGRPPEGLRGRP